MTKAERIPLFPLGLVLFPQEVLPLHIFEDRYKKMISYCLAENAPFGLVGVDGEQMAQVGCTARVRRVIREYDDQTLDIETMGEMRFRVGSLHDDLPYTTAEVTEIRDREEPIVMPQRERLVAQHMKLLELLGETIRPNAYTEEHLLSFRIAASAGLDLPQRQRILEIDSEAARISHLVDYFQDFIPRVQSLKQRRERIQSNGHFN